MATTAHALRRRARRWTITRVLAALTVPPLAAAVSALAYVAVFDRWMWVEYPGVAFVAAELAYLGGGVGCVVGSALLALLRWRRLWACAGLGFALGAVLTVLWAVTQLRSGEGFGAYQLMPHEPFYPVVGALVATVYWLAVLWRNPAYTVKSRLRSDGHFSIFG